MFNRNALLLVAGAAIFALDASVVSAQASPKSQKRIPITKEAPGEVAPRVDTVTVYKTDTLRMMGRVDTVTRTNTVTQVRVDTVINNVPMVARHVGGMYFGLGAGPNLPFGAIRTVNEPGAMGQLQLGWQGLNNPLGIRLDGTYTQFADNADYALLGDRPHMMQGNLDLKLNLPIFTNFLGSSVRFSPYVIGGGSYLRYNNLRMKLDTDNGVVGGFGNQHVVIAGSTSNSTVASAVTDTDWHDSWGYNVGGGFSFHAGKKEAFVEARGVWFNRDSNRFSSSWSVPITFGVNFF
jgi:hypothetical protein